MKAFVPLDGVRYVVFCALIFVAIVALSYRYPSSLATANEMIYFIWPTPARAYELGNERFDATHPGLYDIDRAEFFFIQALERNTSLPLVRHQLARIAFLRGDFSQALVYIDQEIALSGAPPAYYMRGLINGFKGDYASAAEDYTKYLETDPASWAAANDYAWVLLKSERYTDAEIVLEKALRYHPENPWLLNSYATALFERGQLKEARRVAAKAAQAVLQVDEKTWLRAYPGNDPLISGDGLAAFQQAVLANMHTISIAADAAENSVR